MTFNSVRAVGAFLILSATSGCGFMQRQSFRQPDVYVQDVRLAGIGLQGGTIDVILSLYNGNDYRLDASSLRYKAMVDTLNVAEGTIEPRVTLLPKDSTVIKLPVNFGLREVLAAGARLKERGTVPFEVSGDIKIETPFGSVTRPFKQRGSYDGVNISIIKPGK